MIQPNDIAECATNPVKSGIFFTIQTNGPCSAKSLREVNAHIPQATLYRALNHMAAAGILCVVAENRVRAVTEKIYDISEEFWDISSQVLGSNDKALYQSLFASFMLGLLGEFKSYTDCSETVLHPADSGFSAMPIYATKEELQTIGQKIQEIMVPYSKKCDPGQRLHTFAIIVTPPKEPIVLATENEDE